MSYVPTLVKDPTRYVEADAKLGVTSSAADVAGLGVAGALVAALTAPIALAVDAVSYLASLISLLLIRTREPKPAQPTTRRTPTYYPNCATDSATSSGTQPSDHSHRSRHSARCRSAVTHSVACSPGPSAPGNALTAAAIGSALAVVSLIVSPVSRHRRSGPGEQMVSVRPSSGTTRLDRALRTER
jgi:hypothetical protein